MDTTRRKIIQSLAAAGAAAGVAATVPGVANAATASTINGLPLAAALPNASVPEPERPGAGGTDPGPRDLQIDEQNPDLLAPPSTDAGSIPNVKWPFGLSHNRLSSGGWARNANINQFPISTDMAGVDMYLKPGAIRELHWHIEGEWGFVLNGSCQVTCMDSEGRSFVDNLEPGDQWFFPPAAPHSIQAFDQGVEFILVFNDGSFNENSTFLISDTFIHMPPAMLAKNFGVSQSDFAKLPNPSTRYMYPGTVPPTNNKVSDPYGNPPQPFTYHMSTNKAIQAKGGYINLIDSTVFPETQISAAIVTVDPGHMRVMHWHPNNEWQFYIEGTARMTEFASSGTAATYDFQAGDIGYVPNNYVHYIENTGNTTLRFMEVFNAPTYADFELGQWMAVTPAELWQPNLNLPQSFVNALPKTKQHIV
ncbi:MAG TPA: cupin domain-containing protein [Dictyobacter sp.]|jgi:oxalate decarboxylase|nr:cupin domain-containing protein [Dictyobacter sp.]